MLAVDCGNSRIKWARFDGKRFGPSEGWPLDNRSRALAALDAVLEAGAGNGIERVLVANVAGSAMAADITGVVRRRLGLDAELVSVEATAHGIACGYREPARLGVDRWLAMIAARRLLTDAFAVVCAGTAVTFDAVDAAGRHLGGLILPSDRLMLDALAQKTEQIGIVQPVSAMPDAGALLGRSTAEAVAHGSRLAIAACVDRAVRLVAGLAGRAPALVVTGGDAGSLARWLETKAEVRADLVIEGLAIVAGARD